VYLAVPKDSSVQSIQDIKGARVAIFKGTNLQLSVARVLEANELGERDLKVLNLDFAASQAALASKDVDAAFGGFEMLLPRDKGIARIVYSSKGDAAAFTRHAHVLVTEEFERRRPAIVGRVVKTLVKAARWTSDEANRDEVFQLWARTGIPYATWSEVYEGEPMKLRHSPRVDDFLAHRYKQAVADSLRFRFIHNDIDVEKWIDTIERPDEQIINVGAPVEHHRLPFQIGDRLDGRVLVDDDRLAFGGRGLGGEVDEGRPRRQREDGRPLAHEAEIEHAIVEGLDELEPAGELAPIDRDALAPERPLERPLRPDQRHQKPVLRQADPHDLAGAGCRGGLGRGAPRGVGAHGGGGRGPVRRLAARGPAKLRQREDVARSLAQGRERERGDVQAVEQVLAKPARGHRRVEVDVGRGDEPYVDRDRPPGAEPHHLSLLQDPEQLDLKGQREIADFVEEQGAAVRTLEPAGLGRRRPGECSLLVPEQLTLDERLGESAAELSRRARGAASIAVTMQRAPARTTILSCCRGASLMEYVILLGAVALIVIGGLRLFGSRVKTKISGQADSVTALDDRRGSGEQSGRGGDGKGAVAPAGEGKAVAAAAASGASGKGAEKPSGVSGVSGEEASISAGEKVTAGSKVTSTIAANGKSAGSASAPPPEPGGSSFNYFGWVPAGLGVLVLVAVLFKGRRRLQAEAGGGEK
jgi:hypothetical protein